MSSTNDYCHYESCGHSTNIVRHDDNGRPLCEYHAEGQTIIDKIQDTIRVFLQANHHIFNMTLDTLDIEEQTVRDIYQMPDPDIG